MVIGAVITSIFCLLLFFSPAFITLIELKLYDFRFKLRGVLPPPDNVVIAAIDEKSLKQLGRWPWSRKILADLVDRLAQADAAVIAFDVIFPEPEPNDLRFAKSIEQAGTVVLPVAFDFEQMVQPVHEKFSSPLITGAVCRSTIMVVGKPSGISRWWIS